VNDGYKPQDAMQLTSSAHAMFQAIDTHGSGMVSIEQVQRLLEHLGPSFFLQVERLLEAGQMNKKMIDLPTFKLVIVPVLQRFLLAQEVDKLRALRCRLADTPHLPEESVGSEKGKSARRERAHADRALQPRLVWRRYVRGRLFHRRAGSGKAQQEVRKRRLRSPTMCPGGRRKRIHACHMRRRVHACHMRRRHGSKSM